MYNSFSFHLFCFSGKTTVQQLPGRPSRSTLLTALGIAVAFYSTSDLLLNKYSFQSQKGVDLDINSHQHTTLTTTYQYKVYAK
jgi:hypothetical protein